MPLSERRVRDEEHNHVVGDVDDRNQRHQAQLLARGRGQALLTNHPLRAAQRIGDEVDDVRAQQEIVEDLDEQREEERRDEHPLLVEVSEPESLKDPEHGFVIDRWVGFVREGLVEANPHGEGELCMRHREDEHEEDGAAADVEGVACERAHVPSHPRVVPQVLPNHVIHLGRAARMQAVEARLSTADALLNGLDDEAADAAAWRPTQSGDGTNRFVSIRSVAKGDKGRRGHILRGRKPIPDRAAEALYAARGQRILLGVTARVLREGVAARELHATRLHGCRCALG